MSDLSVATLRIRPRCLFRVFLVAARQALARIKISATTWVNGARRPRFPDATPIFDKSNVACGEHFERDSTT